MAGALASGLTAAISPLGLVRRFRTWARRTYPGSVPNQVEIAAWLTTAERAHPVIAPLVGAAFRDAYAQGWLAGLDSADVLTGKAARGEWSFTPGDTTSALRELDSRGERGHWALYGDAGPLMRDVVRHRIEALADTLYRGTGRADKPEALAGRVRTALDQRAWARNVGVTETSRAVNAATLAEYRRDRVPAKEWMTAYDQRVCKICAVNEQAGPIGLDEAFPSGELTPPGHPGGCRCGLIPAYGDHQQR